VRPQSQLACEFVPDTNGFSMIRAGAANHDRMSELGFEIDFNDLVLPLRAQPHHRRSHQAAAGRWHHRPIAEMACRQTASSTPTTRSRQAFADITYLNAAPEADQRARTQSVKSILTDTGVVSNGLGDLGSHRPELCDRAPARDVIIRSEFGYSGAPL